MDGSLNKVIKMMLVTVLSTGKGSWNQVYNLISSNKWSRVLILTNEFGRDHFSYNQNEEKTEVRLYVFDFNKDIEELANDIYSKLKDEINDISVGLNIFSGDGKLHMAVLYALIKMGVGIELVYFNDHDVRLLSENI